MKRYFVLISVCLLVGCATVKHSKLYSDDSFKFTSIKPDNSSIVGTNNVILNEFKKSFEKEYGTNEKLYGEALDSLQIQLEKQLGAPKMEIVESSDANEIFNATGYSEESINKVQSFFDAQNKDYVICLKKITIDEENEKGFTPAANQNAPAGTGTQQSSSFALVKIEIEIWKTSEKKKVYAFEISDKAKVSLFMYGTALKNALKSTVMNTAKYIAKGGVME